MGVGSLCVGTVEGAAALIGHVHEEQQKPAMGAIWEAADGAVPYYGTVGA